jgi:hypothetical protein
MRSSTFIRIRINPAMLVTDVRVLPGPINVYGPGPAGGLPPKSGGGIAPTVAPQDPTPGIATLTEKCHEAYAYSSNIFMRYSGASDIQHYTSVHEFVIPESRANFNNINPPMQPFHVMEDDKVRVSAVLVPHGQIFPSLHFALTPRMDPSLSPVTQPILKTSSLWGKDQTSSFTRL